jgi:hypothetical protein
MRFDAWTAQAVILPDSRDKAIWGSKLFHANLASSRLVSAIHLHDYSVLEAEAISAPGSSRVIAGSLSAPRQLTGTPAVKRLVSLSLPPGSRILCAAAFYSPKLGLNPSLAPGHISVPGSCP